ncbi:MAG: hypothetical protein ACFFD1_00060 [Candidatus Thorarchaeota archaeon]
MKQLIKSDILFKGRKFYLENGDVAANYKLYAFKSNPKENEKYLKVNTYYGLKRKKLNRNPIILNKNGELEDDVFVDQSVNFILSSPNDTDPPSKPIGSYEILIIFKN